MWKLGIVLSMIAIGGVAQAQETTCIDQAVSQTRAKIHEHYAKQGIDASLSWISTVDLSNGSSNGPVHKGPEQESVWYTTYTVVGTLVIEGKGKFMDYGFYVRLDPSTCKVLKVALLRTGKSPYMAIGTAQPPQQGAGGLASQEITLTEIETPKDGSPKIGYTYAGRDEVSVPVAVHATHLVYLRERAEQLIRK